MAWIPIVLGRMDITWITFEGQYDLCTSRSNGSLQLPFRTSTPPGDANTTFAPQMLCAIATGLSVSLKSIPP